MKVLKLSILFCAICVILQLSSCKEDSTPYEIPREGLVCYYEFSGNSNDLSSNGNDGTNVGAVLTTDRKNKTNNSYLFNDAENDYIEKNDPSFKDNATGTFMAWIKVNAFNKVQYVGGISDTQTAENYISLIRIDPTDKTIGVYYRPPGQADWIYGTTELSAGVYYHVALVANGSSWSLFINGQKDDITVKSGTNSGKWFSQLSGLDKFTVGNLIIQEPFTAPPFNGVIDQVLVYNRALTDAEVSDIYLNTK